MTTNRFVLDTNVIVSALLLPRSVFIRDSTLVDVTEVVIDCRDAKDNKFL